MSAQNPISASTPQPADDRLDAGVAISAARLAEANINPSTGLATDYLNHFNQAIMLLEMLSSRPDCIEDFLAWRPMSYGEHFSAARFKNRHVAIAAYKNADPAARHCLETLADTMTAVLEATRGAMRSDLPPRGAQMLAERAVAWLKPLIARADAAINGETDNGADHPAMPQAVVDGLMKR
jgi:hypothetical protein